MKRWIFGLFLCFLAPAAGAQNLVVNPDFDLDPTNPANGWEVVGTGTLSHGLSTGDPDPPSAFVDTQSPQTLTIRQCFEVDPGRAYDFSARSYTHMASGNATSWISLSFFTSGDCGSGYLSTVLTDNEAFPGWYLRWASDVVAPPGAASAGIELIAESGDTWMVISWDNVIVVPSGLIFMDGFETGDLLRWSQSAP